MVNIMCQKALLHISMQEICLFFHHRLVTICVKNRPNFFSVYRQPLSGARTDPLYSRTLLNGRNPLQWKCMSSENEGRLLHQRRVKPSARPCFRAHLLDYHPFAGAPQNKEGLLALPFSYSKGQQLATLNFSFTRTISLSFPRETQTFKEIRLVLGYWVFVHEKITQIGCHVSETVPATNMVQLVPSHEKIGMRA